MRLILILIVAVGLDSLVHTFGPELGGSLPLLLFLILGGLPYVLLPPKSRYFRREIRSWARSKNIEIVELKNYYLQKGKLFWRTSDVQDIFILKEHDAEYWIACGSWFLGAFNNNLKVYKLIDNRLKLISST
ncbi:hypothetical protein [Microbulbifer sp. JTAC008]|uniref:hypothetical protein n=1 Tax=unclassified Microbulbifer TaxID=2619833 RepID=UPI004039E094